MIVKDSRGRYTSTCFKDAALVKESYRESRNDDYEPRKWRTREPRDFREIDRATTITYIKLCRQGIFELNDFLLNFKGDLSTVKVNYGPWKDID